MSYRTQSRSTTRRLRWSGSCTDRSRYLLPRGVDAAEVVQGLRQPKAAKRMRGIKAGAARRQRRRLSARGTPSPRRPWASSAGKGSGAPRARFGTQKTWLLACDLHTGRSYCPTQFRECQLSLVYQGEPIDPSQFPQTLYTLLSHEKPTSVAFLRFAAHTHAQKTADRGVTSE